MVPKPGQYDMTLNICALLTVALQVHGFMAARGDLKDPAVEVDYKKAYGTLLNFFHDNL